MVAKTESVIVTRGDTQQGGADLVTRTEDAWLVAQDTSSGTQTDATPGGSSAIWQKSNRVVYNPGGDLTLNSLEAPIAGAPRSVRFWNLAAGKKVTCKHFGTGAAGNKFNNGVFGGDHVISTGFFADYEYEGGEWILAGAWPIRQELVSGVNQVLASGALAGDSKTVTLQESHLLGFRLGDSANGVTGLSPYQVSQTLGASRVYNPAQITAGGLWSPGGTTDQFHFCGTCRVTSDAAYDIERISTLGLTPPDVRFVEKRFFNIGSFALTFKHDFTPAIEAILCHTGADIVVAAGGTLGMWYDNATSRHRTYP